MRRVRVLVTVAFVFLLALNAACGGGGGADQDLPGPSTTVPMSVFLTTNRVFVDVAQGANAANLAARVVDGSGRPMAQAAVRFSTDLGWFNNNAQSYTALTGAEGFAFAALTSNVVGQASVTAAIQNTSFNDTENVIFRLESVQSARLDLMAQPQIAYEGEPVIITARLSDENNWPIAYSPVTFSYDRSLSEALTNEMGEAYLLCSKTGLDEDISTFVLVEADFQHYTISDLISLEFRNGIRPPAIIPTEIYLSNDPIQRDQQGNRSTEVTASALDQDGQPVTGQVVRFSTDIGNIVGFAITDENGQATATWYLGAYTGQATLTAFIGVINTSLTTYFGFIPPDIPEDGISISLGNAQVDEITGEISYPAIATVLDEHENPVQGIAVRFAATAGQIAGFAITDENGQAGATWYLGTHTGQATITAFIGDVSDSVTVNIIQNLFIIPAEATLRETGQFVNFEIFGGQPPYTIHLSDETFVEWSLSMDSDHGVLQVHTTSMPPYAVDITIFVTDGADTTATATLTLDSTAVPTLILTPAATSFSAVGESVTFTAIGGIAPYTFILSHPQYLSGEQSGNTFTVTAEKLPLFETISTLEATDAGASTAYSEIILYPSVGNPGTGGLTITASGGATEVATGGVIQFFATGGTPPYTWTANGGLWDTDGDMAGDSGTATSASAQPVVFIAGNNPGNFFIYVADIVGNGANYQIEIQQE